MLQTTLVRSPRVFRLNAAPAYALPDPLGRTHELWDELADFEAADIDVALLHLLGTVAELVAAQNAFWLGVVRTTEDARDARGGWRPLAARYLHADDAVPRRSLRGGAGRGADEATMTHARFAGRFRSETSRRDGGSLRGGEMLHVIFPVGPNAEAYYGFERRGSAGRFTEEDRRVAAYAMRAIKWFHRRVMLSHGLLVARAPLPPTERRVLGLLLTELSEKQIASRLGLAPATTHKYVTDIFRKFGVSGRSGLTALWLGHGACLVTG